MRIVAMGSGGVGGFYGGMLAALGGCDVGFVARGANLAAMRDRVHAADAVRRVHWRAVEADWGAAGSRLASGGYIESKCCTIGTLWSFTSSQLVQRNRPSRWILNTDAEQLRRPVRCTESPPFIRVRGIE
jgi:hypothetical protein